MADELTPKQAQFVKEYVADFNATQAAIRAGYSKNGAGQTAAHLLKNPKVQAALEIEARTRAAAAEVTAEEVLAELAGIARANMRDYMDIGEDGLPRLNWKRLTRAQAAALKEVTVDVVAEVNEGTDDEPELVPVHRVKFKLESKLAALDKLGRYFGLFKDHVSHSGSVELLGARPEHELTDEQILEILDKRRAARQ